MFLILNWYIIKLIHFVFIYVKMSLTLLIKIKIDYYKLSSPVVVISLEWWTSLLLFSRVVGIVDDDEHSIFEKSLFSKVGLS